jgi:hypothetical protein
MRFVHLYLVGYFALVIGAVMALWQGGVLERLPPMWVLTGATVAIGLGILLAMTARPTVAHD